MSSSTSSSTGIFQWKITRILVTGSGTVSFAENGDDFLAKIARVFVAGSPVPASSSSISISIARILTDDDFPGISVVVIGARAMIPLAVPVVDRSYRLA